MDWVEVTVRTNTGGADMVSEQIMLSGAKGTVIEDRYDAETDLSGPQRWDILSPSILEQMDEDVLVRGYLPDDASSLERISTLKSALGGLTPERIGFDAGPLTVSVESVREEDWAENWKQYYKPFRVGERLVVKPVWEAFDAGADDLIIEIDPGMAFGNGTHETTFMCLSLLEAFVKPGDQVLDIGTGSGILALAAGMLGAKRVLAVDLDPVAVRVAEENIRRNGMERVVAARAGDLLAGVDMRAELVVANIIADAIILFSGAAKKHVKPGGAFIASGIIKDRERDVLSALGEAGFTIQQTVYRGEWVAIVARV